MSESKMFSNLYLEHYLESLETLPEELKRNFTLMYELDVKNKSILDNLDAASDEYLRKVRELSPERRKIEMEKIQHMFKKSKEHGDEKVKIAIKTYELVDKHIRRLDSDLAKFESEIKEKGRLSQSEDEEDEEELDDKPLHKNSKLNKKNVSKHKKNNDSKKIQKDYNSQNKRNKESKEDLKKKKSKNPNLVPKKDDSLLSDISKGPQEVLDMPVDPNEPTYCTCHQVSYGEMIGCDNVDCPIEWFHFGCMGLNTKPKGRWYCPLCSHMFKKKK
uniref:Inhibitor of growth protein n=2 Tax=Lepeophtheirus salmonis TaxID=72036 RepID=A0A0K2VH69_LEPSM